MDQSTHVSTGLSGSRAGLFRTPISGGVHSATSVHDLPPPALAVRNLMEQVMQMQMQMLLYTYTYFSDATATVTVTGIYFWMNQPGSICTPVNHNVKDAPS